MMDNYCTSCHGSTPLQNSISLTTYDDVKSYAPRITPAIKHTGLYPMPNKGGKLSDCAIRQWDLWIMAEMPE
jgi:mono/diheme cytochrome c family protein